jgi:hypothetical protein
VRVRRVESRLQAAFPKGLAGAIGLLAIRARLFYSNLLKTPIHFVFAGSCSVFLPFYPLFSMCCLVAGWNRVVSA